MGKTVMRLHCRKNKSALRPAAPPAPATRGKPLPIRMGKKQSGNTAAKKIIREHGQPCPQDEFKKTIKMLWISVYQPQSAESMLCFRRFGYL